MAEQSASDPATRKMSPGARFSSWPRWVRGLVGAFLLLLVALIGLSIWANTAQQVAGREILNRWLVLLPVGIIFLWLAVLLLGRSKRFTEGPAWLRALMMAVAFEVIAASCVAVLLLGSGPVVGFVSQYAALILLLALGLWPYLLLAGLGLPVSSAIVARPARTRRLLAAGWLALVVVLLLIANLAKLNLPFGFKPWHVNLVLGIGLLAGLVALLSPRLSRVPALGRLAWLAGWLVLFLVVVLALRMIDQDLVKADLGPWPVILLAFLAALIVIMTRVRGLAVPFLAVFSALVIGGIILMATDKAVFETLGASGLGKALGVALANLGKAYASMYEGALGNPDKILAALGPWLGGAELKPLLSVVRGPSDSLVQSVPYIFSGLAVALGFRAGLFNIGGEGQIGMGWLAAVIAGFAFKDLPPYIHLPLCLLAGMITAGLWAAIAGFLKARTGAHEVITTIMLNYISYRLSEWLLCDTSLEAVQGTCRTQEIAASAYLPRFLPHPLQLHWGFVLALIAVVITTWYLFRTTWGFQLRTVGANPNAAKYGGMSVARTFVITMFLSGALAGLGGASQGLGITHNIALGFQAGYGFDAIALALLGKSHPAGVLAASLLFGVLRAGSGRMQSVAGVPTEIVQIIQAMVIIFIAAPAIIQAIYRLRGAGRGEVEVVQFTRGWGA